MIVFMDIDGTIADASRRFLKAGEEPKSRGKKWSKWLRVVQNKKTLLEDIKVPGMRELCAAICGYEELVYLTGRSEIYREVTQQWLYENGFPMYATLLMRPRRNKMRNGKLKEMLIKKHGVPVLGHTTKYYDNVLVIDDDQNGDIEKMCHKNGWTFLKARSGGIR